LIEEGAFAGFEVLGVGKGLSFEVGSKAGGGRIGGSFLFGRQFIANEGLLFATLPFRVLSLGPTAILV